MTSAMLTALCCTPTLLAELGGPPCLPGSRLCAFSSAVASLAAAAPSHFFRPPSTTRSARCPPTPPLQASELRRRNEARMEALVAEGAAQHEPLALPNRWATSLSTQRAWLIRRFFAIYWRLPEYSE